MVGSKQGHKRYRKRKKKKEKKAVIANNKAQWLHVNVIVFFLFIQGKYYFRNNIIATDVYFKSCSNVVQFTVLCKCCNNEKVRILRLDPHDYNYYYETKFSH